MEWLSLVLFLALIGPLLTEEGVHVDLDDEVYDACVITHAGSIRHEETRRQVEGEG